MPRILFTRETLLALLRTAVAEGSTALAKSEAAFADNFVRAALAANQFIYDELIPPDLSLAPRDLIARFGCEGGATAHLGTPVVLPIANGPVGVITGARGDL